MKKIYGTQIGFVIGSVIGYFITNDLINTIITYLVMNAGYILRVIQERQKP